MTGKRAAIQDRMGTIVISLIGLITSLASRLRWFRFVPRVLSITRHRRSHPSGQDLQEVVVSTVLHAPPAEVFAAIGNPRKPFLTSNPVTTLQVVGNQTMGAGTIYRWTFRLPFGITFRFDEVVTEWVEHERFAYRAISGWQMEAVNALTSEDGRTRLTFTLRYQLAGPWRWMIPRWLLRLGLRIAFEILRRQVERGGTSGQ
jgi:uncharacterized protein YndB with AHSA1/START domain